MTDNIGTCLARAVSYSFSQGDVRRVTVPEKLFDAGVPRPSLSDLVG
ncbi:hypothetical protein [Streptomyces virginiae]|nr:hypothetical protein [Streptomyces virginiae]